VGRVVGAVEIQHELPRHLQPLPRPQLEVAQGDGQPVAGAPLGAGFQTRQRRLAGQIGVGIWHPATDQLPQWVAPQRNGVVLVL
jgi:hypothetical protein